MDWPAIRDRVFTKTDGNSAAGRRGRAESDAVTLIEGRARFTGPHELAIDDGTRITADRIVLATGARPVIPPSIAESGVDYHTSDTVMRLDRLPASMVIVGGGYIAAEFAHLFSGLGVSVSVVNQAGSLLEAFDPEVSGRFTKLASKRWDVRLSAEVTGARRRGGQIEVEVAGRTAGRRRAAAGGGRPRARHRGPGPGPGRGPAARGRADRGRRVRPDDGRGDLVAGRREHPVPAQARGQRRGPHPGPQPGLPRRPAPLPARLGAGGGVHRAADRHRRRPRAGPEPRAPLRVGGPASTRTWRTAGPCRTTAGFCKIYADAATGTLLGAHIMGSQASLLIQPLVQAAAAGQRLDDLARAQYWIHPALTEVVENALLDLPLDRGAHPRFR